MGFFKRLFGAEKQDNTAKKAGSTDAATLAKMAAVIVERDKARLENLADAKKRTSPVSDEELLKCFAEYFSPNTSFYSVPNSQNFKAYFGAINIGKMEMLNHPTLYSEATGRTRAELLDMLNNPKPVVTNMMICGLIFYMGEYAVIRDNVLCVDFSEVIPNCVALYLLLTAEREPSEKRRQLIDAGDGTNKQPLKNAISNLQVLDPDWKCTIL